MDIFSCHKEIYENKHFLSYVVFFRYRMETLGLATLIQCCSISEAQGRRCAFLYRQDGLLIWAFRFALSAFQVGLIQAILSSQLFQPAFFSFFVVTLFASQFVHIAPENQKNIKMKFKNFCIAVSMSLPNTNYRCLIHNSDVEEACENFKKYQKISKQKTNQLFFSTNIIATNKFDQKN